MRLLVTGGAGYVGSHCVRELVRAGHEVVVLDDFSAGHRAAIDSNARWVDGDIADRALLDSLFRVEGFDGVLHFAAFLDVGESVREPLKYFRNNVAGSVVLLEAMRDHGVRRLVFSSTCATYGVPPRVPIVEDMPQVPINPYGRTKLAIEWALRDSAAAWGLGACALRYFNAAGAASDGAIGEDHQPESHLIPLVLQVALGQRPHIGIFGDDYPTPDGTCIRDYIHVEDLAAIHRVAIESQLPGLFRAYNVGTGVGCSVREVIDAARQVTGHPIPAVVSPRREGDPPQLFADPSKAKRELGWQAKIRDIRTVLQTAWRWHQAHPRGYRGTSEQ
ncbi:MAG: UDP-glucose 4-epimerase GalE [Planctomycetota bacterium]|nr:MAG: UDP-glucose 4-epimerase GalE [Planctomycetota bacterium]